MLVVVTRSAEIRNQAQAPSRGIMLLFYVGRLPLPKLAGDGVAMVATHRHFVGSMLY